MRLELRFAVRERARFLSHLECVDTLLAALRRAGYEVALSNGMRPKPVISLALARAVGVESLDELASVELVGEHDPAAVAERLRSTLPRGLEIVTAARGQGTPRVTHARYHVRCEAPQALLAAAAASYAEASEARIERRSPKKWRTVDVKQFAPAVEVVDGGFEVEVAVLNEGSARAEEVARALAECVAEPIPVQGVTRTQLRVERPTAVVGAHGEET